MATFQTPGVYVQEVSTLPPSVAEVSTAVPAFLGYTERGAGKVARINTLLEYEELFGRAKATTFTVQTHADADTGLQVVDSVSAGGGSPVPSHLLYYGVSLYFKNGGGSCYIISVGDYSASPDKSHFETGLGLLEKEDEPTLILLTDAINLSTADYYDLCQQALAQCQKLQDRFTIVDVPVGESAGDFRSKLVSDYLMYGAAYTPYLQTTLNFQYAEEGVSVVAGAAGTGNVWQGDFSEADGKGVTIRQTGATAAPRVVIQRGTGDPATFVVDTGANRLTIANVDGKTGAGLVAEWQTWASDAGNDPGGFEIVATGDGSGPVKTTSASGRLLDSASMGGPETLASLQSTKTALYNLVKKALKEPRVVLPPSTAMAGIYARVDRDRGVWKAPANVGVSSVIGPTEKITHEAQEQLNVDPTAGKSINAIRAFAGKGTLVWGARTLAGNDNEWRYVPVRRLFIMIEESAKKATAFAVFEPNNATTWLKVKGMLESYLYGLWERGALQGSTPEAAYFVNVGLGKTMTTQDVLEGRMIVEIGIAAVRPAEFIILRFTHKLPEA